MNRFKPYAGPITNFLITLFFLTIIGVVGILGIRIISGNAVNIYYTIEPLSHLTAANDSFKDIKTEELNAVIFKGNHKKLEEVEAVLLSRFETFEALMYEYQITIVNAQAHMLFTEAMENYENALKPGTLKVLERAKQGAAYDELLLEIEAKSDADSVITDNLSNLIEMNFMVAESATRGVEYTAITFIMMLIIILVISIIILFTLVILLALFNNRKTLKENDGINIP